MSFKTLVLSLPADIHRREWFVSKKQELGLDFTFFDAISAEQVTAQQEEKFIHSNYKEWMVIERAVIANFLSHLNILQYVVDNNVNALILEDDVEKAREFEFNAVDFNKFDVYNIAPVHKCWSYFVSVDGARKILKYFELNNITVAYDWELHFLGVRKDINFLQEPEPVFVHNNVFISNIAPSNLIDPITNRHYSHGTRR